MRSLCVSVILCGWLGWLVAPALAQYGSGQPGPCCPYPGLPSPYTPAQPPAGGPTQQPSSGTPSPGTPDSSQTAPTDQTTPSDAFAQAPPAGGGAADTYAPNMFGDQFGGGSGQMSTTVLKPGVLNGARSNLLFSGATFTPTSTTGTYFWTADLSTAKAIFTTPFGSQTLTLSSGSSFHQDGPFVISTGSTAPGAEAISFINGLMAKGQPVFVAADGIERNANSRATLNALSATFGQVSITNQGGGQINGPYSLQYDLTLQSQIAEMVPLQEAVVVVRNPSSGGVVGRLQIAEDINPMPRDRLIFDYDFFSHVPLATGGWDVNRIVIGYEKTFFDGLASVEIRLPFATTLNHDLILGAEGTHVEMGNLRLLLKVLLFGNDTINIAGGLAVHLPTADGTRVLLPTGTEVLHINNESVVLSPYLGALFTPDGRLFAQTWVACDFDTGGNPVFFNPDLTGVNFGGRLRDATLLQLDGQVGYWVVRNEDPNALVRGLAPFLELHYNKAVGNTGVVSADGLVVTDLTNSHAQLDLTAGAVAQLGERVSLSMGVVVPLLGHDDRSFDWQLGIRANVFLGSNGQRPNNASYVP